LKRIEDTPREEVLQNDESAMAIADIDIPKDSTATRGQAEGRRSISEKQSTEKQSTEKQSTEKQSTEKQSTEKQLTRFLDSNTIAAVVCMVLAHYIPSRSSPPSICLKQDNPAYSR
jgi:hypothetical protein